MKLSDTLVLDARLTAESAERSIAGQIEFWAKLGRAVEPLLQGSPGDGHVTRRCRQAALGMPGIRRLARGAEARRQAPQDPAVSSLRTVFSDPVGDKLAFLMDATARGYTVILCFIGISGPEVSDQRVAMRVSQGGHDVPADKLVTRYPRTLANLQAAIRELPNVWISDNEDLREPFRKVAVYEQGRRVFEGKPAPKWLRRILKDGPAK